MDMHIVPLEAAALYVGVNVLILTALAINVGRARAKHKVLLGDGGNPDVLRAMRAHANAAEYVPAGLVGIVTLALLNAAAPYWLLNAAGLTLTIGRIAHGIGLSVSVVNAGRAIGAMLTIVSFLLIGIGLIYAGLAHQL